MSNIHFVLDSTANLPEAILARWPNLHVVPLTVTFGDRQWPEDELSAAELFRLISEVSHKMHPLTSQPAPGEFARLFKLLIEQGAEVIVITLSGQLSGTVQSAKTAAQIAGAEKNVFVIDSGTTALGMVKMAEVGLVLAEKGMNAASIAAHIIAMAEATRTLFVPSTLDYLHKGGRIGGASALIGTILQIRPVLYLANGKVAILDKVRTRTKAIARIKEEVQKYKDLEYIGIVHIESAAEAEQLKAEMEQLYPDIPVLIGSGGSVLGSHLGPGLVGLIYQQKIQQV